MGIGGIICIQHAIACQRGKRTPSESDDDDEDDDDEYNNEDATGEA